MPSIQILSAQNTVTAPTASAYMVSYATVIAGSRFGETVCLPSGPFGMNRTIVLCV